MAALETALDTLGTEWSKRKHQFLPGPEERSILQQLETKRVSDLRSSLTTLPATAAQSISPQGAPTPELLSLIAGQRNGGQNARRIAPAV